jgi:hypothetical protein
VARLAEGHPTGCGQAKGRAEACPTRHLFERRHDLLLCGRVRRVLRVIALEQPPSGFLPSVGYQTGDWIISPWMTRS